MSSPKDIPGLQYILPIVVFSIFCCMIYFCNPGRYVIRAEENDRRRERELAAAARSATARSATNDSSTTTTDERDLEEGKQTDTTKTETVTLESLPPPKRFGLFAFFSRAELKRIAELEERLENEIIDRRQNLQKSLSSTVNSEDFEDDKDNEDNC